MPRIGGAPVRTSTNIEQHGYIVNAAWGNIGLLLFEGCRPLQRSKVGRFLRYSRRAANVTAKAAPDPKPSAPGKLAKNRR